MVGALTYEERNPSGDWTPYLPPGEYQKDYRSMVDSMSCVSFSALNSIEMQEKFLTGYQPNYSDRFTATMSGTTKDGNYLWKVADSIRKNGVVLEEMWAAPKRFKWDTYYTAIDMGVVNDASKWLDKWEMKYERLYDAADRAELTRHLKHAPIQVTIPGHAVVLYSNSDIQRYFDSYSPFTKTWEKNFKSAYKLVLTRKEQTEEIMTQQEVEQLQAIEGYNDPEGAKYWAGKPLADYLKARIPDKVKTLSDSLV